MSRRRACSARLASAVMRRRCGADQVVFATPPYGVGAPSVGGTDGRAGPLTHSHDA